VKFEPDHLERPLRKLRKLLDEFSADPPPDDIHALRTQTRRLEAVVDALDLAHSKKTHRLIKAVTPLRKAAGAVRDMDVMIGAVLMLSEARKDPALVRLVEHLSELRVRRARRLGDLVERQRPKVRKRLKQSSKLLERNVQKERGASTKPGTAVEILVTELRHWPKLDESNLHHFRIRVKELRYMLQMTTDADITWVAQLEKVKGAIGEWHDWTELLKIAAGLLDAKEDKELLKRIESIGKEKFRLALTASNAARKRYFHYEAGNGNRKSELHPIAPDRKKAS
jgi:CHAD domain-containing protein